jgi:hypothetical protein
MAKTCFQLKWNCTTGVQPLGAQVRTRVGRSDRPDSSMKTISRLWAAHFFERRPSLALPRQHRRLVAFNGAALRPLRAEAHRPEQAPDVHFAEAHAVQPLDDGAHPLERPQLGAEVVGHGAFQQRSA